MTDIANDDCKKKSMESSDPGADCSKSNPEGKLKDGSVISDLNFDMPASTITKDGTAMERGPEPSSVVVSAAGDLATGSIVNSLEVEELPNYTGQFVIKDEILI